MTPWTAELVRSLVRLTECRLRTSPVRTTVARPRLVQRRPYSWNRSSSDRRPHPSSRDRQPVGPVRDEVSGEARKLVMSTAPPPERRDDGVRISPSTARILRDRRHVPPSQEFRDFLFVSTSSSSLSRSSGLAFAALIGRFVDDLVMPVMLDHRQARLQRLTFNDHYAVFRLRLVHSRLRSRSCDGFGDLLFGREAGERIMQGLRGR